MDDAWLKSFEQTVKEEFPKYNIKYKYIQLKTIRYDQDEAIVYALNERNYEWEGKPAKDYYAYSIVVNRMKDGQWKIKDHYTLREAKLVPNKPDGGFIIIEQ